VQRQGYDLAKRVLDLAAATIALVATAWLLLLVALAIRVTMGAPVLFRQSRPGYRARPFRLVKFRTMTVPRAGQEGLEHDAARLTGFGRLLRAASLDELPTLVNVLCGDMSIVGPRPLLPQYLSRYSAEQARRHDVKPGITGWAQIHGRNALSWAEKFRLDVWYVDHRTLWLDFRIVGATLWKVIRREGIAHTGVATMPEFTGHETDGRHDG